MAFETGSGARLVVEVRRRQGGEFWYRRSGGVKRENEGNGLFGICSIIAGGLYVG